LLDFIVDRLEYHFKATGVRSDVITAALSTSLEDDLFRVVRRVEALGKFLNSKDGKNLLAGVKRAANILRIEEKKDKKEFTGAPDAKRYELAEEKALAAAIDATARLRPRVDAFFDKVTVNVDDKAVRENRLKLLNEIRQATRAVA